MIQTPAQMCCLHTTTDMSVCVYVQRHVMCAHRVWKHDTRGESVWIRSPPGRFAYHHGYGDLIKYQQS